MESKSPQTRRLDVFTQWMVQRFSLRMHMTVLLLATVASGVLSNWLLLQIGLIAMDLRYPFAVLFSYVVFFYLVNIWIDFIVPRKSKPSRSSGLDLDSDLLDGDSSFVQMAPPETWGGEGGKFSGAGASGSWGPAGGSGASSSGGSSSGGDDIDGEGALVFIVAGVFIAAMFGSALYLVYIAPGLLSEVAFNAAMAAGLIKRSSEMGRDGWEGSVLRKTIIPFAIVFILSYFVGRIFTNACPGSHTFHETIFKCHFDRLFK